MYKKCEVCGSDKRVYQKRYIDGNDVWVCDDCKTRFDHDEIEMRLGSVEKAFISRHTNGIKLSVHSHREPEIARRILYGLLRGTCRKCA